jgi:hypothetical protein
MAVIGFGMISFNNASLFNLSFACLLVILSIAHFENKNLLSLFFILIVSRVVGEGFALVIESTMLFIKVGAYVLTISLALLFFYQTLSRLTLLILAFTIPVEIYWYVSDYSAPQIFFFFLVISQTIVQRYFLSMRAGYFRSWGDMKPQNLDYNLSELLFVSGIVNLIMILEYLFRHLTGINLLVIYAAYEYLQHVITMLFVFTILLYTVSHPKLLRI